MPLASRSLHLPHREPQPEPSPPITHPPTRPHHVPRAASCLIEAWLTFSVVEHSISSLPQLHLTLTPSILTEYTVKTITPVILNQC